MIISNIYCNPSSDGEANEAINNFFRNTGRLNYEHQVIDFNRKDTNWNTFTSSSEMIVNSSELHKRSISTGLILHFKQREH